MSAGKIDLKSARATKMLAGALRRASEERGLSLRQVGKMLNYKQAVVLSHMALGRVPIPIDRAEELAEVLELDKREFLAAVVEQRHPEVDWSLLSGADLTQGGSEDIFVHDLEAIAGVPLSQFSTEQRRVMREVAADRHPARRWLTVHEVPVVEALRKHRPSMGELGLPHADRMALEQALTESGQGTPRESRIP